MTPRRACTVLVALLAFSMPAGLLAQDTRCDRGDVEVAALSFEGNTAFTDAQLAAGIVTTASSRARRLLRIVGARRCLDPAQLPLDVARLRLWYRNHGFTEATVDTVVGSVGPRRVEVRFLVTEGPPTLVDTLRIEGLDGVPERAAIIERLPTVRGGLFDRYANAATRDTITRRLRDNGYPDAETFLGYDLRRDARLATVIFTVAPGLRRRIGSVELRHAGRDGGEPEVRASAVRRLVGLQEGDLYRERLLERAKRTLYQSEAFSQVTIEPGDALGDSLIAVNVEVREGYLRAARLGGGWGSLDCFRMTGDLTEYNLLRSATRVELRGRVSKIGIGEPLGGAAALCPQAQNDIYSRNLNYYTGATISQPAVLRASFVPTLTLFSERRSEFNAFLRTTPAGGSLNLTRAIGRRSNAVGYTVEYGRTEAQPALYCAVFNACEAADRAALQRDLRLAVLSAASSYERTDDAFDPSRGVIGRVEARHASRIIGAERDLAFTRLTLDGATFVPLGDDIVFALRLRLGSVFGPNLALNQAATFVPPQERLYAGGPNSVRGFRQNELGPSVYIPTRFDTVRVDGTPATSIAPGETVYLRANPDEARERAVPTGGNTSIVGNVELRIVSPFLPTLIKWTLFTDVGELWNRGVGVRGLGFRQLKWTPGAGISIRTPIGFLRADLAYNQYDRQRGAAYFDAPVAAGGALYCVSPTNTLPATVVDGVLVQASGSCPGSYAPRTRREFFGRWTPSIAIGQAF
ncbi:MAG: BamA/TamA family outer membrane protein [Gemmatimonadaceae bacterium]|nr:BamA/TamA family outer membrane protein [Gemmatimonadaceae bacterium]